MTKATTYKVLTPNAELQFESYRAAKEMFDSATPYVTLWECVPEMLPRRLQ